MNLNLISLHKKDIQNSKQKQSKRRQEKQKQSTTLSLLKLIRNLPPSIINYIENLQNQNNLLHQQIDNLKIQLENKSEQKPYFGDHTKRSDQKIKQSEFLISSNFQGKRNQHPNSSQKQFIRQCQQQIQHLKQLLGILIQQKQQYTFHKDNKQRQQIKDRIIMKLQDELITTKLLLQEEKQKNKIIHKQNQFLKNVDMNIKSHRTLFDRQKTLSYGQNKGFHDLKTYQRQRFKDNFSDSKDYQKNRSTRKSNYQNYQ